MSNPVMEALLCAKATERLQELLYEPPRSWTKEAKLRFLELPADLQAYLVVREKQRDREMRRSQNEAAEARKALASIQQQLSEAQQALAQQKQEKTDGIQQTAAA
jgi:hypothetical protein